MRDVTRRSVLGGLPAFAGAALTSAPALAALGKPMAPAADPVLAAIASHAANYAALGQVPDDEESRAFAEWEARSDAVWEEWERLVRMRPTSPAGCVAFARYVADHELSKNLDGNNGPQIALLSIAAALVT